MRRFNESVAVLSRGFGCVTAAKSQQKLPCCLWLVGTCTSGPHFIAYSGTLANRSSLRRPDCMCDRMHRVFRHTCKQGYAVYKLVHMAAAATSRRRRRASSPRTYLVRVRARPSVRSCVSGARARMHLLIHLQFKNLGHRRAAGGGGHAPAHACTHRAHAPGSTGGGAGG
eukprot:COSAG02_NODE_5505_length_4276_cov_3.149868_3_plen_170_part_00